jgi:hypothetical protein
MGQGIAPILAPAAIATTIGELASLYGPGPGFYGQGRLAGVEGGACGPARYLGARGEVGEPLAAGERGQGLVLPP